MSRPASPKCARTTRPPRRRWSNISIHWSSASCAAKYRATAPFEHWVSRLALNACLNQLRAEKCRPEWRLADLSEEEAAVVESLPGAMVDSHPKIGRAHV